MNNRFPEIRIQDLRSTGSETPWRVIYYRARAAVKKSFSTKAQAEAYRDELLEHWKNKTNPDDDAEANRLITGTGYTKAAAIKGFFENLRAAGATKIRPNATINDGIQAYKARQAMDSSIRPISISRSHALLKCLGERIGSRIAIGFTAKDAAEFLDSLPNKKGEPGKAKTNTKLNYYKLLRGVLRALGMPDPLKDLPKPSPSRDERIVRFFTPEQVIEILRATPPEYRGVILMAVFGCFRPYLLQELSADAVDPVRRTVDIPEYYAKDDKGHTLDTEFANGLNYYPGLPNLLWDWLKVYPYRPCGSWDKLIARIRKKTGYWIHDGLRHTGATYCYKLHGLDAVTKLLTHEGQHLAFKHYVGQTTREAAERFFALRPSDLDVAPPVSAPAKKGPIPWPADDVLAAMLQETSAVQVAKKLGCSDVAILKRCRARGIPKPGVGVWAKRHFDEGAKESFGSTSQKPAA